MAPVSGLTALQALTDASRVKQGDEVLVIGESGGVGSHAVQLAKAFGADVTGVCSTSKLDLLRALGADHVIDYTAEDFADGARRYDLISLLYLLGALRRVTLELVPATSSSVSAAMPASSQQVVDVAIA